MEMRIEVVFVPVSDTDRAKSFYQAVGFHADHAQRGSPELRCVQLTPPGAACSIAFGEGLTEMAPGSLKNVMMVIPDAAAARTELLEHGVDASEVDEQVWGKFVRFSDPDGNSWQLQELPKR